MRLQIEFQLVRLGYRVDISEMSDAEVFLRAAIAEETLKEEAKEQERQSRSPRGKSVSRFG